MKQRVFQIDQECFIIFAEELSSKKERFLRIGNSDFLRTFGESLTFITLVTPLYLGDTFKELDIFRPAVDRKIVGLKKIVNNFVEFLQSRNIDIDNLNIIYAEEEKIDDIKENNNFENITIKKTEEQFINSIKSNKKLMKHSFASFYSDGNIRIFNQNEIMFDLKKQLKHINDERGELEELTSYFNDFYFDSYKKTGLIHSGKSIFFFSSDRYACISDTGDWVKDAIRVGIDPEKIEVLYLTEHISPNSLWVKAFLNTFKSKGKIKLASREKDPFWLNLIPKDVILPIFPDKDTIEVEIGGIKLFFQNKRINVIFKNIKFTLYGEKGFLDRGQIIKGEYLNNKKKINVDFVLDTLKKDTYTLYSYHPVIVREIINSNYNYCKDFWDKIHIRNKNHISKLINLKDEDYSVKNLKNFNNKQEFVYKLFLETIRREIAEKSYNKEISDEDYNYFLENLNDFTGRLIYNNKIIIEQLIGQDETSLNLIVRDVLSKDNLLDIRDEYNPFLFFQKDYDLDNIKDIFRKYKEIYLSKKNRESLNEILKKYNKRFRDIISQKKFFLEEREKLRQFIEKIETQEKIKEEILKEKSKNKSLQETENELNMQHKNDDKAMKELLKSKDPYDKKNNNNKVKIVNKKFVIIIIAAIIGAIMLTSFAFVFGPKVYRWTFKHFQNDSNQISQKKYLKNIHKKYSMTNNDLIKTSVYYKFHMTVIDNLILTNEIAVKNGYSKIVLPYYKKYMKKPDPDWIYPKRKLKMPNGEIIIVKKGDNLWNLCENYLIKQINNDELEIRDLIIKSKTKELTIKDIKEKFSKIKNKSHSEMVRDIVSVLIKQKNYNEWEPYLSKYEKTKK